jgi:hypothetical protein
MSKEPLTGLVEWNDRIESGVDRGQPGEEQEHRVANANIFI